MDNLTFNQVIVRTSGNNLSVIDLSNDTVATNNLYAGVTAHDRTGEQIVGEVDPIVGPPSEGRSGDYYEGYLGIDGNNEDEIFEAKRPSEGYKQGDIFIIKTLIDNNKYSYTAYYFYDSAWRAMDGNYNAENVYFDENITITTAVGNIALENGSGIIPSKGKNIKQVFESIWTSEANPTKTSPSLSITTSHQYKEIGATVTPKYSLSLDPGSYTYGPDTGVTATSWSAALKGETKTSQSGSFSPLVITEGACCSVSASVTHTAGAVPVTNLGNEYPSEQIKSGTVSTSKNLYTGYRPNFYGFLTSAADLSTLNSSFVRGLPTNQGATTTPVSNAKSTTSWMQFFYAVPKGRKSSLAAKDSNNLPLTVNSTEVQVLHEGTASSTYTVFYIDNAAAYGATTLYFTWG